MISQAEVENILTLIAEAKAEGDDAWIAHLKETEQRTHWDGCWITHTDCMLVLVERLVGELVEAAERQVSLDRIILAQLELLGVRRPILDVGLGKEMQRIQETWKV